jgi:hypothetical protein
MVFLPAVLITSTRLMPVLEAQAVVLTSSV